MVMAAAATVFAACNKEGGNEGGDDLADVAPEFTTDLEDIIVTEETLEAELTFSYSAADFGVATQINYAIEAQIGTGNKAVVATSTTTEAKVTLEDLNYELVTVLNIPLGVATDVNFYVSAQMGSSAKLYSQPQTVKVTAIEAGPKKSEWGLVGTINGWAKPDIKMFDVDGYFVAYNVELTDTDEFKIRANEEWNDAKNYGTEIKGTFAPNTIIPVITSGGSCNIGVTTAGTYDIYFVIDATDENNPGTVYLMEAGKTPDQAGEAEVVYIDPSAEKFNVGLSGDILGWDTPAYETNDRAAFVTKEVTDADTYAGTYTFELASVSFAENELFKVRINDGWFGYNQVTVEGLSVTPEQAKDGDGNLLYNEDQTPKYDDGANLIVGEAGTYKMTLTFAWNGLNASEIVATFTK